MAWYKEPRRHGLARRGIKTKKDPVLNVIGRTPTTIIETPAKATLAINEIEKSLPQAFGEKLFQIMTLQPYSLHIKSTKNYVWIKNTETNKIVRLKKGEDFDKDGVVNELDINPFKKGE